MSTRRIFIFLMSAMLVLGIVISPQSAFAQLPTSTPQRLRIPAIGIDTAVESVGLTADGNMDVPKDAKQVAWYNKGPVPGAQGNAVISGHYDDKKGPTVFYKLGTLKAGDQVIVTDGANVSRTFKVMAVEKYPYDKAPLTRIFGIDFEHDLNLITCGGVWNPKAHIYNQRVVVYTRLVS